MKNFQKNFIFSVLFLFIFFVFHNFNTVNTYANDQQRYPYLFRDNNGFFIDRKFLLANPRITEITIPSTWNGEAVDTIMTKDRLEEISTVKTVTIEDGIKVIWDCTFEGFTGLTTVNIKGNSLYKIGELAFHKCTNLRRLEIPYTNRELEIGNQFIKYSGVSELIINTPYVNMRIYAISGATNLRTLYLKDFGIHRKLPDLLFDGQDNINLRVAIDRTIPENINDLDNYIGGAVKWRQSTQELIDEWTISQYISGENCYMRKQGNWIPIYNCINSRLYPYLEYIGSNTLAIKREVLKNDSTITSITIPCEWDGIPIYNIEKGSYELYIDFVTNVTIENGIKNIATRTFINFRGLSTISFPNTLTTIGEMAFYNSGITTINIESNNLTTIGTNAFRSCNSLNSVTINSPNLTTIGKSAFSYSPLKTINIQSNSLTSIGSYAFYNCPNLKKLEIPTSSSQLQIKDNFIGVSGITELIIKNPNTVFDVNALSDAKNLNTLYLKSDDSLAFNNLPNLLFNGLNNSNLNVAIDRTIPSNINDLDIMVGGAVKWNQSNEQLGAEISKYLSGENCYMKNQNGEWIQLFNIKIDDGNEINTIIGVRVRKDTIAPEKLSITVPTSLAILVQAAHTPETEMTPVDVYIGGGHSNAPGEVSGNLKFLNSSTQNGEPVDCVINSVDVYKMGSTWTLDETSPSSAYHINMQVNDKNLNKGLNPLNITLNKATGSSSEGYIYSTTTLVPVKIVIGGNRSEYIHNTTQSPQFNLNWKVSKL